MSIVMCQYFLDKHGTENTWSIFIYLVSFCNAQAQYNNTNMVTVFFFFLTP